MMQFIRSKLSVDNNDQNLAGPFEVAFYGMRCEDLIRAVILRNRHEYHRYATFEPWQSNSPGLLLKLPATKIPADALMATSGGLVGCNRA